MKQRNDSQNSQAVYFDIHKQFLDSDHVARQATEAEGKLQTVRGKGGLRQVCCTPERTACHHGELYKSWLKLNKQWH